MKTGKCIALVLSALMIAGCAAAPTETKMPKTFTVELEENTTTGYTWSYTAEPEGIVSEVGNEYKEPDANGLVGAAGVRIFTFEPASDGKVTLTFNYARSWENNPPAKTCVITYDVKNGEATEISRSEPEDIIPLTEESAKEFIADTLATLTVHKDDTVTFNLPENIPADADGKTKLMITMNADYVIEAGVYSSESFLDDEEEWSGGETFTADLKEKEGRPERIMLRVAFMTEAGENAYNVYAADYVELIAPFCYETPITLSKTALLSQNANDLTAEYMTAEGRSFAVHVSLPDGITAKASEEVTKDYLPGYAPVVLLKNGQEVGTLLPVRYAATDEETIEMVRQEGKAFHMAVYSSVALSNTVEWDTDPDETYNTNKTRINVNRPKVKGEVISDCILAYNVDSEPYFVYLSFKPEALTAEEISMIAKSIVIPPKEGIYSIAAEGIGDEFAPDQSLMPTESDWAGETEREYYQNVIDTLDFSKVNTFVALSTPSDNKTSVEMNHEQTKEFFDLLKSIKLTTMEPENPATGGNFTVYIVTENDRLTFGYNGNWFYISQLGQDKWWIFDGNCASEQFEKMNSEVWKIIHNDIS